MHHITTPIYTIYLYRRDPNTDPPGRRDVGIREVRFPASNLDEVQRQAEVAFRGHLDQGCQSPTAGHVEDETGRMIMKLSLWGLDKFEVERLDA